MTQTEGERGAPDRRAPNAERRRYNRRAPTEASLTPPYYQIFERIAAALEGIDAALSAGPVRLPDVRSGRLEQSPRG